MKKSLLIKFGAPVLALSLMAACGNADNEDPANEEAPLNQEDDNGKQNGAEKNGGMNDGENGGMNGNGEGNGTNNGGTDTDGGTMEDGTNEDTMDKEDEQ